MDPGLKLKKVREKLGLRYRQVEQASNLIAQRHRNSDYVIGLSRLADIENKGVVPGGAVRHSTPVKRIGRL